MKTNKLFFVLLSLLLSLTVFVACTRNNETPKDSDTLPHAETSATTDDETGTSETATETEAEPSTDDTSEVSTEAVTENGTAADTTSKETETAMPRYDYFEADVAKDVTLPKSVYESMNLTLPSGLLVTDEQVQEYIDYLVFQERTAVNGETKVYDQPIQKGDTAYIVTNHHVVEGAFKSFARALKSAVSIDKEFANEIPSTKGVL